MKLMKPKVQKSSGSELKTIAIVGPQQEYRQLPMRNQELYERHNDYVSNYIMMQ